MYNMHVPFLLLQFKIICAVLTPAGDHEQSPSGLKKIKGKGDWKLQFEFELMAIVDVNKSRCEAAAKVVRPRLARFLLSREEQSAHGAGAADGDALCRQISLT